MASEYKAPPLEYDVILEEVKKRLPNGRYRFSERPHNLANSWWPSEPTWEDRFVEDISQKPQSPETRAFEEEVGAIVDFLREKNYPLPEDSLAAQMQLRNAAINAWQRIGRPIRINASTINYIDAPVDLMSSATLRTMPVDKYVMAVCEKTAADAVLISSLKKKMDNLLVATVVFAGVALKSIWSWIWGMLS